MCGRFANDARTDELIREHVADRKVSNSGTADATNPSLITPAT
jgi:hypothetical protein